MTNRAHQLIGFRSGRLVVLERAPNKGKHSYWICQCDCGRQVVVRGRHLVGQHTRSCGCIVRGVEITPEHLKRGVEASAQARRMELPFARYEPPPPPEFRRVPGSTNESRKAALDLQQALGYMTGGK
ncbi:MAG: hypothetical protein MUC42_06285 [Bryobacter sp.]|jgi:hypothetical protein|nr:hypothetical protein [Bryobacter sp.]